MMLKKALTLAVAVALLLLCIPIQADLIALPQGPNHPRQPLRPDPPAPPSVEMREATVDIHVAAPAPDKDAPLIITVTAAFQMHNTDSQNSVQQVSYPCTQFGVMEGFEVTSSGQRKPALLTKKKPPSYIWPEYFKPNEQHTINVKYALKVSQKNQQALKSVNGWEGIDKLLEPQAEYYLFDYSLTSGATWKGPIGKETLTLHFTEAWAPKTVLCNQPDRLKQADRLAWVYQLANEVPTKDLCFAVPANPQK
jgi:hypothetical protein